MNELLTHFFSSESFIPHGHCYLWKPELVGLHLVSDSLIALAYYSIPLTLFYFVQRRQDLPFNWIFLLFGSFIVACGTTHLMEVWTLWHPVYWLSGWLKVATALVSLFTAIQLVFLLPKVLALPSLAATNQKLEQEMAERSRLLIELQQSEEKFRQLAENIQKVFWMTDADRNEIIYVSPAYEKIWGRTCESLYANPKSFLEAIHPDDRPTLIHHLEKSGYQNFACEYRVVRPDQTIAWIQDKGFTIRDQSGNIYRRVGIAQDITSLKQAEEAQRQSEERYRSLVNATFQIVWSSDPDGNTTSVSPAWTELTGQSWEELQQRRWLDYVHPDDHERTVASWQNAVNTRSLYEVEYRLRTQDGSYRDFWVRGVPVTNSDGSIREWVGICNDITVRKQAEAVLRQTNQELEHRVAARVAELKTVNDRLQLELMERQRTQQILQEQAQLLDLAHDTILTRNLENVITFWNHGAEQMYGWTKSEAIGKTAHDLLKTRFPHPLTEIEAELMQQGYWEGELIHTKQDGTPVIASSRWALRRDQQGTPIEVLEINHNVTDRKQVEEALQASQARFAGILEIAKDAIISVNRDQRITLFNQGAEAIFGYTASEVLGQSLSVLLPSRSATIHHQHVQQFEQSPQFSRRMGDRQEVFGRRKDGTEFPAEASISKLNLAGEVIFTAILRDVSDRRAVEQLKDEFISVVSHELRTPLTSIRTSLGLLNSGLLDKQPDKAKTMLAIALESSDRLVRLVNDILDIERIESGRVEMARERCNAAHLMQRAIDEVKAMADKAGVTFSVKPLTMPLWVDSDRIIQTLTNLLSNAIKFSPAGGTIWLSTELQDSKICFQVKDQGRGIPADKLESIFGRFQQVDASDSRRHGGTGLGLAICRSIVQQHGGHIWAESTLGEGSTFYVTLPL